MVEQRYFPVGDLFVVERSAIHFKVLLSSFSVKITVMYEQCLPQKRPQNGAKIDDNTGRLYSPVLNPYSMLHRPSPASVPRVKGF